MTMPRLPITMSIHREKICDALDRMPGREFLQSEVKNRVIFYSAQDESFEWAVSELVHEGKVVRKGGGTVESPYIIKLKRRSPRRDIIPLLYPADCNHSIRGTSAWNKYTRSCVKCRATNPPLWQRIAWNFEPNPEFWKPVLLVIAIFVFAIMCVQVMTDGSGPYDVRGDYRHR